MKSGNSFPLESGIADTPYAVCPICGEAYVHPTMIDCITPGRDQGRVTITSAGVAMDPAHPAEGRGVRFSLHFCCEQGHEVEYRFHFHKGMTFVNRTARSLPEGEFGPDVIWRD